MEGQIIGDGETQRQYVLGPALGKGSFGEVRRATTVATHDLVAVKMQEIADCDGNTQSCHLAVEAQVMTACANGEGFPRVITEGSTHTHYYLIMTYLGPTLHELMEKGGGGRLSIKSATMIGLQALDRLEFLHSKGFVHCDIKPENFLMGPGPEMHTLFMVDFGLSFRFRNTHTGKHIRYKDGKNGITGTLRYCSLNAHAGVELTRRDDVESLIYTIIFLARGDLPWQGLQGNKDEKRQRVYDKKRTTLLTELCKNLPAQFVDCLKHVRSLGFDQAPNYTLLRGLLEDALVERGESFDGQFDWMAPANELAIGFARIKRTIENNCHLAMQPSPKRQRTLSQFQVASAHWVLAVSRIYGGIQQSWTRQPSYTCLVDWLKANRWGNESGLFVSALCHSLEEENTSVWTCVLSSGKGYSSQQIKKCSTPGSAELWMRKKRALNYHVSTIAGYSHDSCLAVVVSRDDSDAAVDQVFTYAVSFPRLWIESQWKRGYYITCMGTAGPYWCVVMSRDYSTNYTRQWFQTSHSFPTQAIKERWSLGFRISSLASKDKLLAICMSMPRGTATSQGYNCAVPWPPQYIKDAAEQNRFIVDIAWKLDV